MSWYYHWEYGKLSARGTAEQLTTQRLIPSYFLVKLLNALKLVSSQSLYIIWITQGPSDTEKNGKGKKSLELIETAQNWFSAHKPLHMRLFDFGFVITNTNRTFGKKLLWYVLTVPQVCVTCASQTRCAKWPRIIYLYHAEETRSSSRRRSINDLNDPPHRHLHYNA